MKSKKPAFRVRPGECINLPEDLKRLVRNAKARASRAEKRSVPPTPGESLQSEIDYMDWLRTLTSAQFDEVVRVMRDRLGKAGKR